MSELYNRIDELCKARGTNITALCKKAGVSRSALSELNAGRSKTLTVTTAQKIADALEVSLNFLQNNYAEGESISFSIPLSELKDHFSIEDELDQSGETGEPADTSEGAKPLKRRKHLEAGNKCRTSEQLVDSVAGRRDYDDIVSAIKKRPELERLLAVAKESTPTQVEAAVAMLQTFQESSGSTIEK